MTIERDSVHFQILERLCALPRPVRGTSAAMLLRDFDDPRAIDELKEMGLIKERGWYAGPGSILIPTQAGEALFEQMESAHPKPASPRWIKRPEVKTSGD